MAEQREGIEAVFERTFKVLAPVVSGSTVGPVCVILLGMAPPWPNQVAVGTLTVTCALVQAVCCDRLLQSWSRNALARLLVAASLGVALALLAYVWFSAEFVHEAPDGHRFAAGWELTEGAKLLKQDNPTKTVAELLEDAGFEEFQVWTSTSVRVVRAVLLLTWLAVFLSLTLVLHTGLLLARQQKQAAGEEPEEKSFPKEGVPTIFSSVVENLLQAGQRVPDKPMAAETPGPAAAEPTPPTPAKHPDAPPASAVQKPPEPSPAPQEQVADPPVQPAPPAETPPEPPAVPASEPAPEEQEEEEPEAEQEEEPEAEEGPATWHERIATVGVRIVARALADEAFRKRLVFFPHLAKQEVQKALGADLPANFRIQVVQEVRGLVYLVLPSAAPPVADAPGRPGED
jgi:hypothetical protein